MFPPKESWRSAVFGAVIGAIITVLFLKFLENERAAEREIRRQDDLTEPQKRPQEHDERNG